MNRGCIRGFVERGVTDGGPIRFVAATEGVKRDGIDLRMQGAQLERFRANPVILFGHASWGRQNLPIGRAEHVGVEGDSLVMDVVFDQEDEFARTVERKLRGGFLNAVSIGFEVDSWEKPGQNFWNGGVATKWELFETSVVPIPMDERAVVQAGRSFEDDTLRQYIDERIEDALKRHFAKNDEPVGFTQSDADKVLASFKFGEGI